MRQRRNKKQGPKGNRPDPGKALQKPGPPNRRIWLLRLTAMLLVPLTLAGLEPVLRLAGYGYSTRLFKPMSIGGEHFLVENDTFSQRFFPPELARTPGPIRMKPNKPPDTYRIFILGESAAMGDPEPAFGAGRYLDALLSDRYPETRFEIINVAFTAINSHVILPIARECAEQHADLWIIYMGNNEMVGPFGAATVFGPKAPPLTLVRLNLALLNTRLGQLGAALGRHLKSGSAPASWGGMQMFLGNQVPPDSPRKENVYQAFEKNLRDILRAGRDSGARILLSTVAVNLKDSPPFGSVSVTNLPGTQAGAFGLLLSEGEEREKQGKFAEAIESYQQAATLAPLSAEAQYRLGTALCHSTNQAAALAHLQAACDLDALPFRADSRINGIIRRAATAAADPGLRLFDAATWLATNAPCGVLGQETFYEHVHFNFDGNYRLALGWAEQIASLLPEAMTRHAEPAWATQELCERRIGLTDWNRSLVFEGMVHRMAQPPLSGQSNNRSRVEALQSQLSQFKNRMDAGAAARGREMFQEAIQLAPDDYNLHENFAAFLLATGDLAGSIAEWERVRASIPQDYVANFRLGQLFAQQRKAAEAEAALNHAASFRPYLSDPWCELGKIHAAESKFDQALQDFAHARRLRPSDPEYPYQTGLSLAMLNRRAEAIEQFRQAIQLNPRYWQAHDALGGQLGLDGKIAEARAEFEQVVQLRPDYGHAHLNLGVALLKEGQASDAAVEFAEAVRLEPTNAIARDYLLQAQSQAAQKAK